MKKEELISLINLIYDVADKITNIRDDSTKFFLVNLVRNSLIETDEETEDEEILPVE